MQQLYYAFLTFIRGKSSNLILIFSLALGLFMGILLFARVAFEMSYDTFYPESDKLYVIHSTFIADNDVDGPFEYCYAPLPAAIKEKFPDEVENATVIRCKGGDSFFSGEYRISDKEMIFTDSCFFETMGLPLVEGNVRELENVDVVFLSESLAKKISGGESVIGQTLLMNKTYPLLIRGVFKDIPENSEFRFDIALSFPTLRKMWGKDRGGWGYDISYTGFVRFRSEEAMKTVEARMPQLIDSYLGKSDSREKEIYAFKPIRQMHSSQDGVTRMIFILSILGFTILLIAAMNYVLIAVSSLNRRSKSVGIHKCNGATFSQIMGMFAWEAILVICCSLILLIFAFFQFRQVIEELASASLTSLFTLHNLWVPGVVVIIVFLLVGLLPGRIYASVPVSHVFRGYATRKTRWKKPLLFIQFAGVPFVFGFLLIILLQYRELMTKDLGYDPEGIVTTSHQSFPDPEMARYTLESLPMVEKVAVSGQHIWDGYSGQGVNGPSGRTLFTVRLSACDYEYLPLMGIRIVEGANFNAPDQVIVNEEFVRRMPWTDSPIGQVIMDGEYPMGTVVGVMNDFPVNSLYEDQKPVLLYNIKYPDGIYTLKLKQPYEQNLIELNKVVAEIFPDRDIEFTSLRKILDEQYVDTRKFRDAVIMAAITILLITLMGLFGYVKDEIRRRSKEIAIRKVNGAQTGDVLTLLSREVSYIALPAILMGTICSYFVGDQWMERFSVTIPLNPWMFFIVTVGVWFLVMVCVWVRSWKVANENPVRSIKSE